MLPTSQRKLKMSINHYDIRLEELKQRSVDRLLCADVFDLSAFQDLKAYLWQQAELLKDEYVISKQILLCIRSASAAINSRAEYVSTAREHRSMARDFSLMLDMIIAGEVEGGRQPDVQRVI
jgi:hypothetical protein